MNYEEIIIDEDSAIKTAAVIEVCTNLAKEYYWRFHSIRFTIKGLVVYAEDQGGYPFEAIKIEIAAEPKTIQKACITLLRSLASSREEGSKVAEDLSDEQLATILRESFMAGGEPIPSAAKRVCLALKARGNKL